MKENQDVNSKSNMDQTENVSKEQKGVFIKLLNWIKGLTAIQLITLILTLAATVFAGIQAYKIICPPVSVEQEKIIQMLDDAKQSNERTKVIQSEISLSDSLEKDSVVQIIRGIQEECKALGNIEVQLFSDFSENELSTFELGVLTDILRQVKIYGERNQTLYEDFQKLYLEFKDEVVMNPITYNNAIKSQEGFSTLENEVILKLTEISFEGNTVSQDIKEDKAKKVVIDMLSDDRFASQIKANQNLRNEIMMTCNQILNVIKKRNK